MDCVTYSTPFPIVEDQPILEEAPPERAFIVGNGPSLRQTPLDALADEFCIGMNRIHLIYPYTYWRPSIYVKTDHNPALVNVWARETLLQIGQGIPCYLWEMFKTGYPEDHPNYDTMPYGVGEHSNVTWIKRCDHHMWAYYSKETVRSHSWHLPEICTAYSGIGPAMQIAVLNGASEIYLIGADLGYGRPKGTDHFIKGYDMGSRVLGDFDTRSVMAAHEIAKESCPVPIYNATIGGELELYPRVNLYELLNGRVK